MNMCRCCGIQTVLVLPGINAKTSYRGSDEFESIQTLEIARVKKGEYGISAWVVFHAARNHHAVRQTHYTVMRLIYRKFHFSDQLKVKIKLVDVSTKRGNDTAICQYTCATTPVVPSRCQLWLGVNHF